MTSRPSLGAHAATVALLLDRGASVDTTDQDGQTALHYICKSAQRWGSMDITQTVGGVTTRVENPRIKLHIAIAAILSWTPADLLGPQAGSE